MRKDRKIDERSFEFSVRIIRLCRHIDSLSENKLSDVIQEATELCAITTSIVKTAKENL